jgi:hypothetical protein
MFSYSRWACVALLGVLGIASAALRDDAKKDDPAADDKQVVSSKATHKPAASSVNFRKDLGLPLASLTTLGGRIDAARRAPDPVALAHAASELSVAEKVSGKQASLTSTALISESAELAKLRRKAAEMQAVSRVAEQIATESETIKSLRAIITSAEQEAKADALAVQQNQEPTWAPRKVIVNNYTTQYLTIYVNGIYKTEIGPGLAAVVIVEHRWNPTVLTAYGDQDIDSWGPRNIWGRFTSYTWNIN